MVFTMYISAQYTVEGTVTDADNSPLIGVNIVEAGTVNGTITDLDGNYRLNVANSNATLVFSYTGFSSQEIPIDGQGRVNVLLSEGVALGTVQVVGTRSYKRSATTTPVAVDIIDIQEIANKNGNAELNKILQYLAPSFNAQKQSGSDGAEHIDPASLRGLGPDQTLVLINGKRRHQSSLVNIFGTRGRGNSGTDMNAIPASSIERIEILRDGAAAQYGSDAIAGVINIVLRSETNKLTGSVTVGGFNPNAPDESGLYTPETPNVPGNFLDLDGDGTLPRTDGDPTLDGITTKVGLNYGFDIMEEGYINFTTEFINKEKTLRPGATFRRGFGEAEISGFGAFFNAAIPVGEDTEFYAFGGRNYRDTDAFAFTRNAGDDRAVPSIYPNGFTPRITSIITDNSISTGFRRNVGDGWSADFNNTYGKNVFHYTIKGTNNATLGVRSPTEFDAGGHTFAQNTTNLDFSKYFDNTSGTGFNLAFGLEYKTDNFTIFAGEEGSYGAYDVDGLLITSADQVSTGLAAGSQGFPGYSPANEVDRSRSNIALYGDVEFDLSEEFLVSGALRFENFSDFGSTLNWKLATRYLASDQLTLRAALSTGFRAPSLTQLFYNLRFTGFQNGVLTETLLAANGTPVTEGFGIQPLKQEESLNASLGVAFKEGPITLTVDGYYIDISDRVVISGFFDAGFLNLGVDGAQFFANAADTRSLGLDVVLSYRTALDNGHSLSATLAGNFNQLEVTDVKGTDQIQGDDLETFFGARERSLLEDAAPAYKAALNLNYDLGAFNVGAAATQFGGVSYFSFDNSTVVDYAAKAVFDLTASVDVSDNFNLTLGLNNLFNTYPTQQDANNDTDSGGYFDAVQMGFGGSYYYLRAGFNF
jgi:iron complex outermembrane receptor protein